VDPERERALLAELAAANPGPLSAEGLEELVAFVLDLSKREVARES
jgi:chorismate mutase